MNTTKVLWATRIGEPSWKEQIITERAEHIEAASKWALANGFDRLRVSVHDNSKPDFIGAISI
jgi:pyrroloquinoline quinone (PQQ) biosynthesis protein C